MTDHSPWQLFPSLTDDEFAALKDDIASRGVLVPVEYDEHGQILDGHHRVRACSELGLKTWPRVVRSGMSDVEKRRHVRSLNLNRRHLTQAQKREQIAGALKDAPERTDRQHARDLGVHHTTVGAVRGDMEESGEISHFPVRQDPRTGNLSQPTVRPKPTLTPSIFVQDDRQQERANAALQDLGDAAPPRTLNVTAAEKIVRNISKETQRQEVDTHTPDPDDCDIREGDFRQVLDGLDGTVDAIITDPPYPQEYIPLLSDLSEHAARILKPGGICAVMIGQSYLPEVYQRLTEHLHYHWTVAYMTPGGQAVQLWDRKVNTFWKPVLILTNGEREEGRWFGDVSRSDVNDNDKRHHHWGQSESGTADLVERLTSPGELICDPFLGGGTTAAVALRLARRFVGCEIEPEMIATSRRRIAREVAA
jgi:16S rRNA G966 N2-methylase RsmD